MRPIHLDGVNAKQLSELDDLVLTKKSAAGDGNPAGTVPSTHATRRRAPLTKAASGGQRLFIRTVYLALR